MPKKKLTNEEVKDIIACEGLGYAVTEYISSDRLEDGELRGYWEMASHAMSNIYRILDLD